MKTLYEQSFSDDYSERKKQHKQHSLIYSKMIFITKDYKLYRNFKLPVRKSSLQK